MPRPHRLAAAFFVCLLSAAPAARAADIGGWYADQRKRESQIRCEEWVAQARRGADRELAYRVSLCYTNGWGVPEDAVAAEAWLRRAAERGHRDAQLALGDLLLLENRREAYRWYAIAAEANHPGAYVRRERIGALMDAADTDALRREARAWQPVPD
jgi:TPR repeat protein